MNQYLLLRRLRGPALLVTFGITALLDQYNLLGYGQSWPLYLIVIGILQLAERAALAQMPVTPPMGYPPVGGVPSGYGSGAVPPLSGSAIVPVVPGHPSEEGRS